MRRARRYRPRVVVLAGGASERRLRAYGAELVRFAESTPLLLLEGPGWRVAERRRGQGAAKGPTARWNSSPASRFPTNRFASRRSALPHEPSTRTRPARVRHVPASGAPAQSRTLLAPRQPRRDGRDGPRMPHPHGQRWIELPVLGTTAVRRHPGRVLRQPGRPRQPPDDRVLVRRRLCARTEGRGPRPGRLRRTARLADQGGLGDLARRDAGESRQSRRPRRRRPRNAEGDPGAQQLQALTGPRRRPHHRPLPGGRRRDRHRLLPLVPAMGRGPPDRRQGGGGRSRKGDGHLQALADPARNGEGRRLSRNVWELAGEMPSGYCECAGHVDGCCRRRKAWDAPAGASRYCPGSSGARANAEAVPFYLDRLWHWA